MLFSIIIPTYNRPHHVTELLEAWTRVDFPRTDFEIVLADDGGSADLGPIVAQYAEQGLPVTLLKLPHRSASAARAAAIDHVQGEFVLCMDDDCRPSQRLLKAYADAARAHPGAALGGPFDNLLVDDFWATATQEIICFVTEEWNRDPNDANFFTFSNLVFPMAEFHQFGGYDSQWLWRTGEDRDVCRRWREWGGRMVFVPDAMVTHAHELTWWRFLRQHFHYGQGNYASLSRRRSNARGAPSWSGAGFYARLVARPFRRFPPARALALLAAFSLAQAANLVGFVNAAWRVSRAKASRATAL